MVTMTTHCDEPVTLNTVRSWLSLVVVEADTRDHKEIMLWTATETRVAILYRRPSCRSFSRSSMKGQRLWLRTDWSR